jgi:hypothetical protein
MVRDGQKYNLPLMLKSLADFRVDRPRFEDEEELGATAVVERIRQSSRGFLARCRCGRGSFPLRGSELVEFKG